MGCCRKECALGAASPHAHMHTHHAPCCTQHCAPRALPPWLSFLSFSAAMSPSFSSFSTSSSFFSFFLPLVAMTLVTTHGPPLPQASKLYGEAHRHFFSPSFKEYFDKSYVVGGLALTSFV